VRVSFRSKDETKYWTISDDLRSNSVHIEDSRTRREQPVMAVVHPLSTPKIKNSAGDYAV